MRASFVWRAIAFAVVFATFQLGWQATRGTSLQRFVVHDVTLQVAAVLANRLTPGLKAQAVEYSLRAPGGGLNIVNGCEGTETLFTLWAAFTIAPLAWRLRLLGMLAGTVVVFAVNEARILTLFYAYRADHRLFDLLHGSVTPIVLILIVLAFFYAWLTVANRSSEPA